MVKGGRCCSCRINWTVVESRSKRKREEMIERTSGEDDNGEQWTEIEELDYVEGEENTPVLIVRCPS